MIHRLTWRPGGWPTRLRRWLSYVSPLVDYYDAYGELGRHVLSAWCVLDTHDTLTDRYKHLRSLEQIRAGLHPVARRVPGLAERKLDPCPLSITGAG